MKMINKHNGTEYTVIGAFPVDNQLMVCVMLHEAIYVGGLLTRIAAFPRNDFLPADGEFAEILDSSGSMEESISTEVANV